MFYILDVVQDTYSAVLATVNFICFAMVMLCAVYIFVIVVMGQFSGWYKHLAVGAIATFATLLIVHFYMIDTFGIPLILPPMNTPYFVEFMHIIQFIATIAVLILGAYIFAVATLKNIDRYYGRQMVSAVLCLIILIAIHMYLYDAFGIQLIFPPDMW